MAVGLSVDGESLEGGYPEVDRVISSADNEHKRRNGEIGDGLKRARKHQRAFIGELKRAWIAFERQCLVAISQFYVK